MSALLQLALTNVKLYLREPSSAFFTIAFAPMLLVLFGFIYGNEADPPDGRAPPDPAREPDACCDRAGRGQRRRSAWVAGRGARDRPYLDPLMKQGYQAPPG